METFLREIYPVGHGGFAFEKIGNYSIVFDCGSKTSPARVSQYINHVKHIVNGEIDRLYISHFDKDHVNSIHELIDVVGVKTAVIPYIPDEYTVIYDAMTRNAYSSMRRILFNRELEVVELSRVIVTQLSNWEWIAKPMLSTSDWTMLGDELAEQGINKSFLQDPGYVNDNKKTINNCFKKVFGSKGPNSKGLILLSQKVNGVVLYNLLAANSLLEHVIETGAFYTGDANLISPSCVAEVQTFLQEHFSERVLLLQIPHHGSCSNSGIHFDLQYPATYYYFHDITAKRFCKNTILYNSLKHTNSLLEVKDVDADIICQKIELV